MTRWPKTVTLLKRHKNDEYHSIKGGDIVILIGINPFPSKESQYIGGIVLTKNNEKVEGCSEYRFDEVDFYE